MVDQFNGVQFNSLTPAGLRFQQPNIDVGSANFVTVNSPLYNNTQGVNFEKEETHNIGHQTPKAADVVTRNSAGKLTGLNITV